MPITNDSWNLNASGNWDDALDWSAGVPNSNDDAVINTASIQTITHSGGTDFVHTLTVGNDYFDLTGGSLTLLAGGSFALNYTQTGGTLAGAGTVSIAGNGYLLGGNAQGTLNLAIGGTIALANYTLGGSVTLTNNAATNETAQVTIGDNTGVNATIDNASTGTYAIAGDYGIGLGATSAKFINAGTLEKAAGSGTSFVDANIADTGTISVASGTLEFRGPTDSFAGAISGGGQFALGGGGTDAINAGTVITTGTFGVYDSNTIVTFNENLAYAGSFAQNGANAINLNGHTLTLSGPVSLANYYGTPTVNGSGTLATSGATSLGSFVLGGTVNWRNSGTVSYAGQNGAATQIGDASANAATFTNTSSGHFNFVADIGLGRGAAATSSFVNQGVLAKTAGSGNSVVSVNIVDTGTISAATGELEFVGPSNSFAGAISGAGQFALGGGGTDAINAGTVITTGTFGVYDSNTIVTFNENLTYAGSFAQNGANAINLNGHTLTLSGPVSLANYYGTPTVNGSGTLATSGATSLGTFVLGGTVNWSNSGTVSYAGQNGAATQIGDASANAATFTNTSSGHFNFVADIGLGRGAAATSSFVNQGVLAKTAGSGNSVVSVDIVDTGTISAATGVLEFVGPNNSFAGAISGAGQFALGGGGTDAINAGTTISTAIFGVYDSNTIVTFNENLTYAGSFAQSGANAINLNGHTLTLSGPVSLANNFGTPTVNGSGTLATSGATSLGNFVLGGTVNWSNSGTISENAAWQIGDASVNAAKLTNQSTGKLLFVNDSGVTLGSAATSAIVNAGQITKTGGSGASVIDPNVTNTGTIEVQTGEIELAGAVSGVGTLKIDAGTKLRFDSSVATGSTVDFTANSGTLLIGNLATFAGAVSGFVAGDVIDLAGQTFTSMSYAGSTVTLTLGNNSTETLKLTSSLTALQAVSDGAGGTDIMALPSPYALTTGTDIYAFASGTNTVTATAATLTSGDSLISATATNTLSLSGGGSFNLASMAANNFDHVSVAAGSNYAITVSNVDVGAGQLLAFYGTALKSPNTLSVNASAATQGKLFFYGGAGADTFVGGGASDVFNGEGGNDTMTGGSGTNIYQFTTALNAATNDPTITNFHSAADLFDLSHTIFSALTVGALPAADFIIGSAATTPSQHIIYNSGTGALLYDPDGSGSQAAVQFAHVSTGLSLTAANFKVV